jgi:hypothetical protein
VIEPIEQYVEDGAAAMAAEQLARAHDTAVSAGQAEALKPPLLMRSWTEEEARESLKQQQRAHLVFLSPKRRAEGRAAASAARQLSLALMSLRCERDQQAKAAAQAAADACRRDYDERAQRMQVAFDTGKDWRAVK